MFLVNIQARISTNKQSVKVFWFNFAFPAVMMLQLHLLQQGEPVVEAGLGSAYWCLTGHVHSEHYETC